MPERRGRGIASWGSWHTSDVIGQDCPQDGRRHSVSEAVALNDKVREHVRARMWARHKEWLGTAEGPQASTSA